MKYYYIAPVPASNRIAEEGIQANEKGVIPIIVLKESFLMAKFVLDVYAYEMLGLEEYSYFEVSLKGFSGQIIEDDSHSLSSEFYNMLAQPLIQPEFLKRITTNRYEGMGLDVGIHLVENKEKFNIEFKKKILSYYHEID